VTLVCTCRFSPTSGGRGTVQRRHDRVGLFSFPWAGFIRFAPERVSTRVSADESALAVKIFAGLAPGTFVFVFFPVARLLNWDLPVPVSVLVLWSCRTKFLDPSTRKKQYLYQSAANVQTSSFVCEYPVRVGLRLNLSDTFTYATQKVIRGPIYGRRL
jgi:hypothetical protein